METPFVIDQVLPMGVTLIHARPTGRMSWMSLAMAYAVASGGNALGRFPAQHGEVLYMSIHEDAVQLRARLKALFPNEPRHRGVRFSFNWPLVGAGFEGALRDYLAARPCTRLVVIDELNDLLPGPLDYDAMCVFSNTLGRLCYEFHIALVLLQTTFITKDTFFGSSGTMGITSGCEAIAHLRSNLRDSNRAELLITSRSREDTDLPLYWNEARKEWLS
jgi:hypothetical protein